MRKYLRPVKSQYTENEVAEELGLSVDRLRTLIRERIMVDQDEARQGPSVSFQPSDLLLLRFLSSGLSAQQATEG